jgi:hypothetical protein
MVNNCFNFFSFFQETFNTPNQKIKKNILLYQKIIFLKIIINNNKKKKNIYL